MKVVLFGPPGVGKGTQAEMLASERQWTVLSMGELLRDEIRSRSTLGSEVEDFLRRGVLVPDELILRVVDDFIIENKDNGLIFDGFPRNLNQAIALEQALSSQSQMVNAAVGLVLAEGELIKRLIARLYCVKCGRFYNTDSQPPRQPDICDGCGGKLTRREDDREEVVRGRLKVYQAETRPLVEYYRVLGVYREVSAGGTKEDVFSRVKAVLDADHA